MTLRSPLPPPATEEADTIERLWNLYLVLGVGVFALIAVLTVYVAVRFRRRDDELPRQKHYNIPMEITYTVIPLIIVIVLVVLTVLTFDTIGDAEDDPDLVVEVTAFQWQWQFHYPESGVTVIGGPADDLPELVLPTTATVQFDLEALDVIHSFWITSFRFKRDMIPGQPQSFQVAVEAEPGTYPYAGVCAEFCGLDHHRMRFGVRLLEPDEFDAWLAEQADTPVPAPVDAPIDAPIEEAST